MLEHSGFSPIYSSFCSCSKAQEGIQVFNQPGKRSEDEIEPHSNDTDAEYIKTRNPYKSKIIYLLYECIISFSITISLKPSDKASCSAGSKPQRWSVRCLCVLPGLWAGKSSDVEVENLLQPSPSRTFVWWIWETARSLL